MCRTHVIGNLGILLESLQSCVTNQEQCMPLDSQSHIHISNTRERDNNKENVTILFLSFPVPQIPKETTQPLLDSRIEVQKGTQN